MAAVSDDTGLEVDALGGAPGVYSARFSGDHATYAENVAKLVSELERVGATAPAQRTAVFRSVAFVAYPDGGEVWAEGRSTGVIALHPAGDGGFGYDPVFAPDGFDGRTFAQMSPAEKHGISHRGRAFRALADRLAGTVRILLTAPGATASVVPWRPGGGPVVSEVSQGPGWWLASDGRWYPPEQAPGVRPSRRRRRGTFRRPRRRPGRSGG